MRAALIPTLAVSLACMAGLPAPAQESAPDSVLTVEIEIKPGSGNSINPKKKAQIPVAIMATSLFDGDDADFVPWTIDAASLRFGPAEAKIIHDAGHENDVDGDGDFDMIIHFSTPNTGISCGDTEAKLTGATIAGESFEGVDKVKTTGCK